MLGTDVQAVARTGGHEVVALSHADLNVADVDAVDAAIRAARPDAVINCAAYTDVDGAEGNGRDAAYAVNSAGAANMALATASAGAWLIHVSTDYVFDGTKTTGPYVESDPTRPRSVYGASKLDGELAVAAAAPGSHTIVRTSWLFGNHGPCFPATMMRLARQREQLCVVDDQRGCPTFTPHLAQALLRLAVTEQRPLGVVHVAGAGECTWFEFARQIVIDFGVEATVKACRTTDCPRPAKRPAYSVMRSERRGEAPVLAHWREGLRDYAEAAVALEMTS